MENLKFNQAINSDDYNSVKFYWPRNIILFMATYPFFSAKWLLKLMKNLTTHHVYKDGELVGVYTVEFFIQFMKR